MNKRIEAAYEQRPRRWVFELAVALVVAALLIWSGTAVETAGTTQSGCALFAAGDHLHCLPGYHRGGDHLHPSGLPLRLQFDAQAGGFPWADHHYGDPHSPRLCLRTVPAFVYGLMFIRVTGPGAFAGLLTMSLCSVGMVSKMYIEAIEDLDVRVLESLDAAGCTTWQKIRYGILPQLMPNFASTAIYRFDINLRDATVLGLVGAGGIGAPLIFAMNAYRWEEAGAILAGLIVLVLIVEWISTKIRVKLARG